MSQCGIEPGAGLGLSLEEDSAVEATAVHYYLWYTCICCFVEDSKVEIV